MIAIRRAPDTPFFRFVQNSSGDLPKHVIAPMPVITALRSSGYLLIPFRPFWVQVVCSAPTPYPDTCRVISYKIVNQAILPFRKGVKMAVVKAVLIGLGVILFLIVSMFVTAMAMPKEPKQRDSMGKFQ